jgi:hypothetical protein
MEKTKGKLKP